MSQLIQLQCRWCKATPKRIHLDEDGKQIIPERCPNPKCRKPTWLCSDSELIEKRKKQNENLFKWRGLAITRHRITLERKRRKTKPKKTYYVCRACDIVFQNERLLERHNQRRHANEM